MPDAAAPQPPSAVLEAVYFDGESARAHAVTLSLSGAMLQIRGDAIALDLEADAVHWSERTRHGPRVAHLTGGAALHCRDAAACDAWLRATGRGDSWVVQVQQSWRWVLASLAALVLLLTAVAIWGVPWFSQIALAAIPHDVDTALGEATLARLDKHLTAPTALDAAKQQRVRDAFARAAASQSGAHPGAELPAYALLFRRDREKGMIGPNAFALPGGTMIMTDAMVELFDAEPDVLTGVLAHELGHVRQRHGMRMVVQASLIGLLSSIVLGDFSSLLAAAPVVLSQAGYSRDAEREADAFCAAFLKAAAVSPALMISLFEKLGAARANKEPKDGPDAAKGRASADASGSWLGIAFASHPADKERTDFFRSAAR
jgi:Zn-dependent protease with chaperone function